MKKNKIIFNLFMLVFILSCSKEQIQYSVLSEFIFEKTRILKDYKIPQEDIQFLQKLGFNGSSGIIMEKIDYINNLSFIYYLMEWDIAIRKNSLKAMVKELSDYTGEGKSEQFRTTNLVNSPRNIHVIGMNINNATLREGLIRAVENYNNLNIGLSFTLEFRIVKTINQAIAASNDSDILAKQLGDNPGGSSGFPSGGNPYPSLYV